MSPHQDNVEASIESLRQAKKEVDSYLKDVPNLQMRCNNVLRTLINGLLFTINKIPEQEVAEPLTKKKAKPLTHVLGKKLITGKTVPIGKTEPEKTEVDKLRETAKQAYDTFVDRTNDDLKNSLTDMEIRAVARLAKIKVTPTEPAKIDNKFIDLIRQRIKEMQAELKVKEEAKSNKADSEKTK